MTRSISLTFGGILVNIVLLPYENFEPSGADGSGGTWAKVLLISEILAGWLQSKFGVSAEVLKEKGGQIQQYLYKEHVKLPQSSVGHILVSFKRYFQRCKHLDLWWVNFAGISGLNMGGGSLCTHPTY